MSIFSKIKSSISKITTKIENKLKFPKKEKYIIPETKTISDKKLPEIGEGVDIPEETSKTKWLKFKLFTGDWYSIPYDTSKNIEDLIIDTIYDWQNEQNYEIDITLGLVDVLVIYPDKTQTRHNLTQKYWEKYVLA